MPENSIPAPKVGSVTIGGHAVLLDWHSQLRDFLDERLPSTDILFSRWLQNEVPPNPLVEGASDYLEPPYPPLPPIQIGELQWPSGLSRFARALYPVDWKTLLAIAEEAWGYERELDDDDEPIDPDDVPESWGIDHYPVTLSIYDSVREFEAEMYALPPYRVTGGGIDLWLLPLVDQRFLYNRLAHEATDSVEDWDALFGQYSSDINSTIAVDTISSDYGVPDPRLYTTDNPAAELSDIAALSVGLRMVREPATGLIRAIDQSSSESRRDNNGLDSALLLSGGRRGVSAAPNGIDVYCQKSDERFEAQSVLIGGGPGTVTLAVWSSWFLDYNNGSLTNQSETDAFVQAVANSVESWFDAGGQYCFAGALEYSPSGYDDYLSIQVLENEKQEYRFTSRIYELPQVFLPPAILAGGRLCKADRHYQYHLLSDWYGGVALAARVTMDGTVLTDPFYVLVHDPQSIFDYQEEGDWGIMFNQCGTYYAIQADCEDAVPAPPPTPPTSDDDGACCISLGDGEIICEEMSESRCESLGGTFQGSGTPCDPYPCS